MTTKSIASVFSVWFCCRVLTSAASSTLSPLSRHQMNMGLLVFKLKEWSVSDELESGTAGDGTKKVCCDGHVAQPRLKLV